MKRLTVLLVTALVLSSCNDLETAYGRFGKGRGSINGVDVFTAMWEDRYKTRYAYRLDDRIQLEADTILHIEHGEDGYGDWNDEVVDWLDDWFALGYGDRQLIVLLRNGDLGPWLCRRWIAEIDAELATIPADKTVKRQELEEQRQRLHQHAIGEGTSASDYEPSADATRRLYQCALHGREPLRPPALAGDPSWELPDFARMHVSIVGDSDVTIRPLIADAASDRVLAAEILFDAGRMLVVADTISLLDAGLVDPQSRAIATMLLDEVASNEPKTVWQVRRLVLRGSESEPPNILALLLSKPPFNIIILHIFVLLLLWAWYRGAWLGRVVATPRHTLGHFGRHIAMLATRMRDERGHGRAVQELATWFGRPQPGPDADAEAATATAAELYEQTDDFPRRPR